MYFSYMLLKSGSKGGLINVSVCADIYWSFPADLPATSYQQAIEIAGIQVKDASTDDVRYRNGSHKFGTHVLFPP